tara:strand:- start:1087 stop:6627 length:5541 start_codon:yes stop_codon:yes gene_type:complete
MTDNTLKFNIFGPATRDDVRVGYISTDRGFVNNVTICEANELAKKDPGMLFIFRDRKKIEYMNINSVNALKIEDLIIEGATDGVDCGINSITATEDAVGIASVKGIMIDDKKTQCRPEVQVFGGGGLGVLANPIIGKDGSVLAVDADWPQGFGYEYTPAAKVVDPCGIGAGAVLKVEMLEGNEVEYMEYIEYDDEEDFEDYKICPKNEVGYGKRYNIRGSNDGEWDPNLYFDGGVLSFEAQLEKWKDFLLNAPNPWWTTRSQVPTKTTSGTKVSREKYDVNHWAWGSVPNPPGLGSIVGNLYLELFGRKPEPGGFAFWQKKLDSGVSREEIKLEMMTMPEYALVQRDGRWAENDHAWVGGAFYKPDLKNFMNSYAISPIPISNVIPSDFGGQEHYFEWDIDFPHKGEYIFKFQCDNEGILYVDGEKQGEYKIGAGGAAGSVLSPPEETKVDIKKAGNHKIRVDLLNGKVMRKVAEQNEKLQALSTSDEVKFDIQLSTMYGASATIEGLDISYEKSYGVGKDVFDSITKKVEYGRIYDVRVSSNNKRTGNLPPTNKALIIDGDGNLPGHSRLSSPKRIEFDDDARPDGSDFDVNATFTIDKGNATWAADGKSIIGTGEQTITLWWNDRRTRGRAINSIKLGSTIWTRKGSGGSETHVLTLGGGIGQIGGENNKAHLRTKGQNVLQMEDIPGTEMGGGGVGNFYDDVVITADQGRFFDINGLTAKYTLGDRPLDKGTTSTESTGELQTIFNTADFINKADRPLWKTNLVTTKDSSFTNRYGISPFDTGVKYESSMAGTYTIKWHNVKFPVSGEYDIGIGVDDNVRLRIKSNTHTIGTQVDIKKDGFFVRGDGKTATGTSLYRRFIEAGSYTIEADLEQVEGGDLGYRSIAGADAGRNPMSLAINIETVFTEKKVQAQKSWNQNPLGVAMTIEAPAPPVPQEVKPKQEGRCPPNPFWSTRFPAEGDVWYPFIDQRKVYRYAVSPIIPYGEDNTSGGSKTHSNTWKIIAPYDGFYKLKAAADDSAVIKFDGEEVLRTVGVSSMTSQKFFIKAFNDENPPRPIEHTLTVDVSNVGQEIYDSIDKRIFSTQGWSALGTQVDQTLNTNEVEIKMSTSTMYGASASIPELDMSIEKEYGIGNDVSQTFTKQVEFDKVYDVKLTSNTIRTEESTSTIGGSYPLVYTKLKAGNPRRKSDRRLEYDDNPGNGFDVNAALTIDNVTGGTAKFSADGSSIEVQGDEVKVTLTFNWNDNPRRSGRALETIAIKDTVWRQLNWRARENRWVVESVGSHTYTVTLAGKTTTSTTKTIGGANNGAVLRTKGENVLQMEDIPHVSIEQQKVIYDDVIISASQGRFFDINGTNAKYVLERKTKKVLQGGIGSGTVKDGVTYIGPELFHKNFSGWGPFMNKASVSQNPSVENTQPIKYTWENVDFPETGNYKIKFQNDAHADLYLDGKKIIASRFDNELGVSDIDAANFKGSGVFRNVLIEKGKHTLTVGSPSPDWQDTLFKQPAGYEWHKNPSGFALEILKDMKIARKGADGKVITKSWKENPVMVSAHLIPPPCPRLIEGKGSIKKIIPIVPGCGYPPGGGGGGGDEYDVLIELTDIIIENPGINYDPEDEVVITGIGSDPIIPPFKPKTGLFGEIIDIELPPRVGVVTTTPGTPPTVTPPEIIIPSTDEPPPPPPPGEGEGDPTEFPPPPPPPPLTGEGDPIVTPPETPTSTSGYPGFTKTPNISISTRTGTSFVGTPVFEVRRTPPLADPNRLLQVTDLVGLKQTGYYDGKPYYGSIFYKNGIKYAGWYETAGQLVQIYDTLQESITAMVTTPPSAIQRQGSDVTSNDPRLDIPGTPDNLTY